ncbi:hypothetical protein Tsubulata_006634 [Turnera subulata]|uniref:Uncharacterized protein n=1 Tax=Turnera subulata TaxID=218843 RepID=A0A9Q0J5T3_9ROSI|nr:hypothetical protein Tsubulata_006634 [Turnera subulata]
MIKIMTECYMMVHGLSLITSLLCGSGSHALIRMKQPSIGQSCGCKSQSFIVNTMIIQFSFGSLSELAVRSKLTRSLFGPQG